MTDLSEQEERPGGGTLRGCVGAFFGALVGELLWIYLISLTADYPWGQLTILLGVLPAFSAVAGYRIFRGGHSRRAALWTLRGVLILAPPPAFFLLCLFFLLPRSIPPGGAITGPAVVNALRGACSWFFEDGDVWLMTGYLAFIALLFSGPAFKWLLRYADPQWLRDPRYLASRNAGGATYNLLPAWPLPPMEVPETFLVGKELRVSGERLTYLPGKTKERTFSVRQVAGVLLGPSGGENILYDENRDMLAQFAWSRNNALVLGHYLLRHQIPFVDGDWAPLPLPEEVPPPPTQTFVVRESKVCLVLGWIDVILFTGLLALLVWEECSPLWLLLVVPLDGLGVFLLLSYYRRKLVVDGQELTYTPLLGKAIHFTRSQIGSIRFRTVLTTWELRDRQGERLAWFENNMVDSQLMLHYLHYYLPRLTGEKTERT